MSILGTLFGPRAIPIAKLGPMGERRAAWFYRVRGYRIVERNLRTKAGEADLVVRRGNTVVIAEVKTRQSRAAGEGHEAVDQKRRERMIRIGDVVTANDPGVRLRYDILSLYWTGRRFVVTQYADAFQPIADARSPWKWRAP